MLNTKVYGRLCSNEDYMLQKLLNYNEQFFVNPAPAQKVEKNTFTTKPLCYSCYGLKRCAACKGFGESTRYGNTNICGACKGSGLCKRCKGSGYEK